MAEKEVELSKRTNTELVTPYLHVGACCVSVKMPQKASLALDSAYQELIRQGIRKDQESLVYLMNGYLRLGNIDKATECFTYLDREAAAKYTDIYNVTMGSYFKSTNHIDSAIVYQKKALQNTSDVNCKYDASKELFDIYIEIRETIPLLATMAISICFLVIPWTLADGRIWRPQ